MSWRQLTQLVAFRTGLAPDRFVDTWRPVADGFLARGLQTITLTTVEECSPGGAGVRFLSRNTWPEPAYRQLFPSGLAADGATAAVSVVQAGVFALRSGDAETAATARPDRDLSLALLHVPRGHDPDEIVRTLLAALPDDPSLSLDAVVHCGAHAAQRYDLCVTVHGPAGSGAGTTGLLRAAAGPSTDAEAGLFLTGRDLLSLTR